LEFCNGGFHDDPIATPGSWRTDSDGNRAWRECRGFNIASHLPVQRGWRCGWRDPAIGEHVGRQLNRPVIVDNRTGAGGRIGALAVKDAVPDGSTLLVAAGAQMYLQPHVYANLGYDPLVDLPPVSQLVTFSQGLVINAQISARSMQELADWIKANPERASFGSPGAGTAAHFAGVSLSRHSRSAS
jgi:Tripartite tricarboxylate transporter family receptor